MTYQIRMGGLCAGAQGNTEGTNANSPIPDAPIQEEPTVENSASIQPVPYIVDEPRDRAPMSLSSEATMEAKQPTERTTASGFYYDDGDDEEVFVPAVEDVAMGEAYGRQLDRNESEPSKFRLARERTCATPFPRNYGEDEDEDEDDEDMDRVHCDEKEEDDDIFVPPVVEVGIGEAYGRQLDREGSDQPSTFSLVRERTAATPFHNPRGPSDEEELDELSLS